MEPAPLFRKRRVISRFHHGRPQPAGPFPRHDLPAHLRAYLTALTDTVERAVPGSKYFGGSGIDLELGQPYLGVKAVPQRVWKWAADGRRFIVAVALAQKTEAASHIEESDDDFFSEFSPRCPEEAATQCSDLVKTVMEREIQREGVRMVSVERMDSRALPIEPDGADQRLAEDEAFFGGAFAWLDVPHVLADGGLGAPIRQERFKINSESKEEVALAREGDEEGASDVPVAPPEGNDGTAGSTVTVSEPEADVDVSETAAGGVTGACPISALEQVMVQHPLPQTYWLKAFNIELYQGACQTTNLILRGVSPSKMPAVEVLVHLDAAVASGTPPHLMAAFATMRSRGCVLNLVNIASGKGLLNLLRVLWETMPQFRPDHEWHMHWVLLCACRTGQLEVVKWLVGDVGLSVNGYSPRDDEEPTPLMVACKNGQEALAHWLVEVGGADAILGSKINLPLLSACEGGCEPLIRWLVQDCGVDVDLPPGFHRRSSAVMWACVNGLLDTLKLLVEEKGAKFAGVYDEQDSDHDGKDCLEVACYRGRLHIVQWLVERFGGLANIPNKAGNHPCQRGSLLGFATPEVAQWLVDTQSLDVNDVAPGASHPLVAACQASNFFSGKIDLAYYKWLVESCGADVHVAGDGLPRDAPMSAAVYYSQQEAIQYLVDECGVSPHIVIHMDETIMSWMAHRHTPRHVMTDWWWSTYPVHLTEDDKRVLGLSAYYLVWRSQRDWLWCLVASVGVMLPPPPALGEVALALRDAEALEDAAIDSIHSATRSVKQRLYGREPSAYHGDSESGATVRLLRDPRLAMRGGAQMRMTSRIAGMCITFMARCCEDPACPHAAGVGATAPE